MSQNLRRASMITLKKQTLFSVHLILFKKATWLCLTLNTIRDTQKPVAFTVFSWRHNCSALKTGLCNVSCFASPADGTAEILLGKPLPAGFVLYNLYLACGLGEGSKKRSKHQYFIGMKSCQKASVGRNKYFCAFYFDYGHIDSTEITLMKKHVASVREETGELDMCRLFSTLMKVESAIGQKFHNYNFRLSFDLNGYLFGFRLCFHSYLHNSRNKLKA